MDADDAHAQEQIQQQLAAGVKVVSTIFLFPRIGTNALTSSTRLEMARYRAPEVFEDLHGGLVGPPWMEIQHRSPTTY
jgi:hypothetical protein